ncbi:hypothetical protein GQ457_03G022370 [Hibiscus cannabinus]
MEASPTLERSGSTLVEDQQRIVKKVRNMATVNGDDRSELSSFPSASEDCMDAAGGGDVLVPPQVMARHLGEMDVDVIDVDVCFGGDEILPKIMFSDRVHDAIDTKLAHPVIVRLLEEKKGRFARLTVVEDLDKPLKSRIIIDGQCQDIKYEGLLTIYYACGKFGHVEDACGQDSSISATWSKDMATWSEDMGTLRKPEDIYGPWMHVVNMKRRPVLGRTEKSGVTSTIPKTGDFGSYFECLSETIPADEIVIAEPAILKVNSVRLTESSSVRPVIVVSDRDDEIHDPERAILRNSVVSGVVVPRVNSSKMGKGLVKGQGGVQQHTDALVASVAKATPVETSLHKAKHPDVQIEGSEESYVLRERNGRVLPISIHGSSSKDKVKGVHGLRGSHKSGFIVKKRNEQGSATSTLATCVSSLVSKLNQVTVPLPHSPSSAISHDSRGKVSSQFVHRICSPASGEKSFFVTFTYASLHVNVSPLERQWGSSSRSGICQRFNGSVLDLGLIDMGFFGPKFTWSCGTLFQSLDRCLGNSWWYNDFPTSEVVHLSKMGSDHRHVLLSTGLVDANRLKSQVWNREIFGHIGRRKTLLLARIQGVEKSLESSHVPYLVELEEVLKRELNSVFAHEESLWNQKARSIWIDKGCDPFVLKAHVVDHFQHLFASEPRYLPTIDLACDFHYFSDAELCPLLADIMMAEVQEVVFSMAPLKAPGVDGSHVAFVGKVIHRRQV